jgi:heparosan-N-sulfate-glucuronate 5-epimerase
MKRNYFIILVVSFISASIVSNFTDKKTRAAIEVVYGVVMGKPMVYDISQTDEKGIPFVIEGTIGKQRNPTIVCNKAFFYYDKFVQGDTSQWVLFLNCADWLIENSTNDEGFSVLNYNYDWPVNKMVSPWRSGLANGLALQVLVKAHVITNDEKYLAAAKRLLNSFYVEVKDGGVTYKSESDGWWFEEYADDGGLVSRVLNGHQFALLGIYDYFQHTQDSSAKFLFEQGNKSLKNNLSKYDKGDGNSFYDVLGRPTTVKYHHVHIDLLNQLFEITNEPIYRFYSDKWKAFKHPTLMARLTTPPVKRIDVAIWLVNFAIVAALVVILFYLFKRKFNFDKI